MNDSHFRSRGTRYESHVVQPRNHNRHHHHNCSSDMNKSSMARVNLGLVQTSSDTTLPFGLFSKRHNSQQRSWPESAPPGSLGHFSSAPKFGTPFSNARTEAACPTVPPPAMKGQNKLPQFDRLYEEFDRMTRQGVVIHPPSPPPLLPPPPPTTPSFLGCNWDQQSYTSEGASRSTTLTDDVSLLNTEYGSSIMNHAAQLFLRAYTTASSKSSEATVIKGWYKEAEALLNEILVVLDNSDNERSNSWPNHRGRARIVSSDSGFKSEAKEGRENAQDDPDSTLTVGSEEQAPAVIIASDVDQPKTVDLQQHLREMKPSTYLAGSPTSCQSAASSHGSDNDADVESVASSSSHATKSSSVDSKGYSPDLSSACSSRTTTPASTPKRPTCSQRDTSFLLPPGMSPYFQPPLMPPPNWLEPIPHTPGSASRALFTPQAPRPSRHDDSWRSAPTTAQRGRRMTSSDSDRSENQKHKEWITDDILEMIVVRDRLYKRMKKHPAPDIIGMYKKVRNMVVGMTRNAKRAYEKRMEERLGPNRVGSYQRMSSSSSFHSSSSSFRSSFASSSTSGCLG